MKHLKLGFICQGELGYCYLCPGKEMDAALIYQQDTLSGIAPVNDSTGVQNVAGASAPQDTASGKVKNEVQTQKTYTNEQIRKWRLNQENKLLIDSSRYIKPRPTSELSSTEKFDPGFALPYRERKIIDTDWLTVIIFACILLFATVRYSYAKYIEHLFLSLFNYATSARMLQEKSYPVFHGAFRLEAIFYISFSVFLFQSLNILLSEKSYLTPSYFFIILGLVLFYFFCKKFLYLVAGSMFEATSETREYIFNIDNFNRSLGILLLPVIILVSFAPIQNPVSMVYLGLAIVAIFNLVLLQRGILILLKKQFSIFYLFLYLCTLEFLPLLLIYKVVVE